MATRISNVREKKVQSPPTIIDVAERAGVSIKTVSRVINAEPKVTAKTRDLVMRVIHELGYQRNVYARGLRAEKSLVLGLLYENPQGDYPADILYGALSHCRANGYHLVVEVLRGPQMGEQTAQFLSQTKLDGAIMTPPVCDNHGVLQALKQFDVPYVRISPKKPRKGERYVAIDDLDAARTTTEYLFSLGHRRIALIKGIAGHAATELRLKGYLEALSNSKIAPDSNLIIDGEFDYDSGYAGAEKLLSLPNPPTVIFAGNDENAAGVLAYAHEHNIRVPDDLSVCGFDGGTISRVVWPKLTTVRQPIRALGESAVRVLIEDNDEPSKGAVILPFELVRAGSTAAIKGKKR